MLEKIKDFLLQGDRRQAYHYAMDQKLWAHAMVIASSIDKDAWKEVVNEFLQAELASAEPQSKNMPLDGAKSWESLRMAYSLFSGQGSASGRSFSAFLYTWIMIFSPISPRACGSCIIAEDGNNGIAHSCSSIHCINDTQDAKLCSNSTAYEYPDRNPRKMGGDSSNDRLFSFDLRNFCSIDCAWRSTFYSWLG